MRQILYRRKPNLNIEILSPAFILLPLCCRQLQVSRPLGQVTTVALYLSYKVQHVEFISLVPGQIANNALGNLIVVSRYLKSEPSKLVPFTTSEKTSISPKSQSLFLEQS
jgi:hypothetical protein